LKDKKNYRLGRGPSNALMKYIMLPELENWKYLWPAYISIQRAHSIMLTEAGFFSKNESEIIQNSLKSIEKYNIESIINSNPKEDLYFTIERLLSEQIGQKAGHIHLGRSRNDMNATAVRIVNRDMLLNTMGNTVNFLECLNKLAKKHVNTIMPGMTHRQLAQPITLGFWLVGVEEAIKRDFDRLQESYRRTNLSPLGAVAFSGTNIPINRERTAELLGFDGLIENALDSVASRDFLVETVFAMCLQCVTLSRVASDLIMWGSNLLNMVEIDDAYAGISSIMPQKKNPVALEHCRARGGLIIGELTGLLSILRGTFYEHSRDTSEMLGPLIRSFEETNSILILLSEVFSTLHINLDKMRELADNGFSMATDVVNYLSLQEGWSFREAHSLVSYAVALDIERNPCARNLSIEALKKASIDVLNKPLNIDQELFKKLLDAEESIQYRKSKGGTSSYEVNRIILENEKQLKELANWISRMKKTTERIFKTKN